MNTTTTRFIIADANNIIAADLGDQNADGLLGWESEERAEAALESLAETTGWDVSGYRVRPATEGELRAASQRV